jgi:hypothetical protein
MATELLFLRDAQLVTFDAKVTAVDPMAAASPWTGPALAEASAMSFQPPCDD